MRSFFIASCKLIGLLQLYWALGTLSQAGLIVGFPFWDSINVPWALSWLTSCLLSFFQAYFLIFRTEAVAAQINLPVADALPALPDRRTLVTTAVVLAGLYALCACAPKLLGLTSMIWLIRNAPERAPSLLQQSGGIFQLLMAIILLTCTRRIATWILAVAQPSGAETRDESD